MKAMNMVAGFRLRSRVSAESRRQATYMTLKVASRASTGLLRDINTVCAAAMSPP
jgi:hypothetical protein